MHLLIIVPASPSPQESCRGAKAAPGQAFPACTPGSRTTPTSSARGWANTACALATKNWATAFKLGVTAGDGHGYLIKPLDNNSGRRCCVEAVLVMSQ